MPGEIVSKGIEPMCGGQWVYQHLHDLDGWHPAIEISQPGSKYSVIIKDIKVLNKVISQIVSK